MQLPEPPKRPESTTVFVSLALGLLVLFTYLNAAAIPSRKLLQKVVPIVDPDPGPRAIYPKVLEKVVAMALTKDELPDPYVFSESVVLVNAGILEENAPSALTYREELLRWLSEVRMNKRFKIEVVCFVGASATMMSGLTDDLARRRAECIERLKGVPTSDVFARSIPEKLSLILHRRNLLLNDAVLVTLTEYANVD